MAEVDVRSMQGPGMRRFAPSRVRMKVLLVEDSVVDASLIQRLLGSDNFYAVTHFMTLSAAATRIRDEIPDVVILDLNLPDSMGLETFRVLHRQFPDVPIVVLSSSGDGVAMEAMSLGAQDYILKGDLDSHLLVRSLSYAIERNGRMLAERRNSEFEQDIAAARKIQQRLLPKELPSVSGYDIAGTCQPAEACGGDFFDCIQLYDGEKIVPRNGVNQASAADGFLDLVVADVSSHGFAPALTMVGTRRMLRACAHAYRDVGDILTSTNWAVYEDTLEGQFVAAFYGRLHLATRTLTYSAAGHPAWILRRDGTAHALPYRGVPLGLFSKRTYRTEGQIELDSGDMLLSMTDGAWEAANMEGEYFGLNRLFGVVQQYRDHCASTILDQVVIDIRRFSLPNPLADDITLLLVKVD